MLFQIFQKHVDAVLDELTEAGTLPAGLDRSNVTLEPPRDPAHGDLSTNAAMVLSKAAGMKPRDLAEKITEKLGQLDDVQSVDIAGPGFINLRVAEPVLLRELLEIAELGSEYGRTKAGASPSMSNMFPPIRPDQCTWVIVAVRSSAMRWPICSKRSVTR